MAMQGWDCELKAIPEIHRQYRPENSSRTARLEAFRQFVMENADKYDVIDFDYVYLPFSRKEFSSRTLLVARSVLFLQHLLSFRLREPVSLMSRLRKWVRSLRMSDKEQLEATIASGKRTAREADLVTVPTSDDRLLLEAEGIPHEKIVVLPYGISWEKWPRSDQNGTSSPPTLICLGTFDFRKGCLDLVDIAQKVFSEVKDSRLRLLGTRGLMQTEAQVRSYFSGEYQDRLEIIPQYASEDLPKLLRGATLGIFPSYLEGLPLGLIEMVAGGVPVLAYTVPGPSTVLPAECLAPRGQWQQLAGEAIRLLKDDDARHRLNRQCWEGCQQFDWQKIGRATSEIYIKKLEQLRA
jgi:glycosyltransferase involved in cell wall biosynthesis